MEKVRLKEGLKQDVRTENVKVTPGYDHYLLLAQEEDHKCYQTSAIIMTDLL